jgi:hypothetical protein
MKSYTLLTCAYLVAATLSAACSDGGGTEPETSSLTGVWSGDMVTPPPANAPRSIRLTLQETNTNVTGSGEIADVNGVPYYTCTVSGTHVDAAIEVTLDSPGFAPVSLTGNFTNASTITATLNGGGFVNTPVTLKRK